MKNAISYETARKWAQEEWDRCEYEVDFEDRIPSTYEDYRLFMKKQIEAYREVQLSDRAVCHRTNCVDHCDRPACVYLDC